MKKQGFTLIELMVVIVIMGILAAVAVPKLFGMIAKSKASEVPTAAGTWINMQDAYFQEKSDVGDWTQIGYSAPGTGSSHAYESNTFWYFDDSKSEWYASPKSKLNDCAKGSATTKTWGLKASANGANGTATAFEITDASAGGTDCKNLTASWDNLTRSSGN